MAVASVPRLFGQALVWQGAGLPAAGRALARALAGGEQERMIAGIALVRAGQRSVAVIEQEFRVRGATPTLVRVLADIDCAESRQLLNEIGAGGDEAAALARALIG